MNVAIVSNFNGIGLQRDAELLAGALAELGHSQHGIQFDESLPEHCKDFDLAIYLEVIPRNMLGLAPVRFFFGNPEWTKPEIVRTAQRHMHKVFAKTWEAKRIFDKVFPGKTFYTGFMARDQFLPDIERRPWFLHIGGNSSMRGTQEVLDAWKWKQNGKSIDRHLIVVSRALKQRPEIPMVTYYDEIDEERLRSLQNQCLFHIYPSSTEGYGHAIHEACSVGAILITTNAPPMNECAADVVLPAVAKSKYNLADVYEVSAIDIFKAAKVLSDGWSTQLPSILSKECEISRNKFHAANDAFKKLLAEHLAPLDTKIAVAVKEPEAPTFIRKKNAGLQIAFIGNFKAEHSTENQIKWALEEGLGHDVEMLQENEVNLTAIQSAAQFSDLLFWVRTPGWLNVRDHEMLDFLNTTKIPTVSIHLDKFFGIPEREALIGRHPFWKTKFVFTADGSRQEDFAARDVNHFWMRPAVSEVYCHPGTPREEFMCDVGFVGAREYHSEYPFRGELVSWLEKTYTGRFKHVTGVRGHLLNDAYASMKVVVGDCFQAGTPHYWSDRVPETMGRYGFLVHPLVKGLPPVCDVYQAQNLESLHLAIERSLEWNSPQRKNIIEMCAHRVRAYDTWTVHMREILEKVMQ
jgi:Glycosyl transferases group 1